MSDLFSVSNHEKRIPLAESLRPMNLDEVVGHSKYLSEDGILRKMAEKQSMRSLIFWGPPGVGKTTLARILAKTSGLEYRQISAIFSGVAELKKLFLEAEKLHDRGSQLLLFVDEIHRFNKAQQDAFLPVMEDGKIILIGATTENPSFELNSALLSRAEVIRLERLNDDDLLALVERAKAFRPNLLLSADATMTLISMADGDGRALINLIERLPNETEHALTAEDISTYVSQKVKLYDKNGDEHYNLISALHKSIRGSDPDAALYWFARMLEGGEDPHYLARRILRMAIEDIGLADPEARVHAMQSWEVYERLGSPEGELALAETLVYLALAPKSNSVYVAYKAARILAKKTGSSMPPEHILNAPTKLMKDEGYGKGYQYDHDAEDGFSGQNYFPDGMKRPVFYVARERGFERELRRRTEYFTKLREKRQQGSKS